MAIYETDSGGRGIYFIVGALVVAVLVIGFFALGGSLNTNTKKLDITIEAPKVTK